MKMGKRIFLFVTVNLLFVVTLSSVAALLGLSPRFDSLHGKLPALIGFSLLWGFGGAFLSLALSRVMAKWTMGVELIDPHTHDPDLMRLYVRVQELSRAAGLPGMPQVGIYESDEVNAFATGPTRGRALVAVSTGLLRRMNERETDGVLAHEVAHIANGDMVTMTLLQGVVNAFVLFFARVVASVVTPFVDAERRPTVQFAITFVGEILLGFLGAIVVAKFSRHREFRADAGGAALAGGGAMIAALQALKRSVPYQDPEPEEGERPAALSAFMISGRGGLARWLATHPDLDERIEALQRVPSGRGSLRAPRWA